MDKLEFRSIEVDQCRVCRGVWLDHKEIDQLLSLKQLPERLINAEIYERPTQSISEGHRTCPRCLEFLIVVDVDGIRLDVCSECKGFFADRGEVKLLDDASERRYKESLES